MWVALFVEDPGEALGPSGVVREDNPRLPDLSRVQFAAVQAFLRSRATGNAMGG